MKHASSLSQGKKKLITAFIIAILCVYGKTSNVISYYNKWIIFIVRNLKLIIFYKGLVGKYFGTQIRT